MECYMLSAIGAYFFLRSNQMFIINIFKLMAFDLFDDYKRIFHH